MKDGRAKKSFNNIMMGFLNQFTSIILTFISRTIFIKTLGIELLGINGLFSDILSLLSMIDLGFSTSIVYSFYKPIAENDTIKIAALTNFYKRIYRYIAIAITIFGLGITPFIRVIVNTEMNIPMLEVYYLLSLLSVVISYLFVYKTSIITADQKNYIITYINIIVNFIKTIAQIVALIIFKNFIMYLCINLLGIFFSNYIASRKATKLYPYIKENHILNKVEQKRIFNNIKSIFLYKISSSLLTATDNTLISTIIGTVTVGYYSNYLVVTNKISAIIYIIFGSLTASIGNLIVSEGSEKRYEIFNAAQSISFIICGIVITSFSVLINDLIKIWIGPEFTFYLDVVIAISLNMYLSCVLQPLWSYREATGMYLKTKYIMLIAAIVNLVLSIFLGKLIGLSGILLASCISRISTYFWYEPLLLFKEYFDKSVVSYYKSIIINFFIVLSISTIFNVYFSKFNVNSWIELFIKSGVCVLSSTIIFLIIYFKSEGCNIILKKLKIKEQLKING